MATHLYKKVTSTVTVANLSKLKIGVVVAEWNSDITQPLLDSCLQTLHSNRIISKNCIVKHVPGTVELTSCAKWLAKFANVDAVIVLGCVIQGDTPHFDYVCDSVTQGITELNLQFDIPFILGVLTTNTLQQAKDRSGGKLGNKGEECAIAALKMIAVKQSFKKK